MEQQVRHLKLALRLRMLRLCSIFVLTTAPTAYGISEFLELYNAPQALALGNAMTADAHGYLSNYYNPAGLPKMPRRRMQLHLVALGRGDFRGRSGPCFECHELGDFSAKSNPSTESWFVHLLQLRGHAFDLRSRFFTLGARAPRICGGFGRDQCGY